MPIELSQYADDTFIYLKTSKIQEGMNQLQQVHQVINKYLQNLQLPLSPDKTKFIILTPEKYENINENFLEFNDSIRQY